MTLLVLLDSDGMEAYVPVINLTISADIDGNPLSGFPIKRRIDVDEIQGFNYERPDDGDAVTFGAIPADQLDTINTLLLRTDREITLRVDGQSDAGIVLKANGVLLLTDCTIDAGAGASNAKVNNNSGDTVRIRGLAGGT